MSEDLEISRTLVEELPLFKGFSGYDMELISEYLEIKEFKPYEYVFKEGDPYGSAYFLIEGAVQILKKIEENKQPKVLAEIRVPHMFGELALISMGKRSASVLTLEPLTVAELSSENFEKLITFQPEIAVNIIRRIANVISDRLKVSNENFVHLSLEIDSSL